MIVRDESAVIARCLHSVKRFVDSWCIVDTGSKDDTMDKIREVMEGIPGELHERKWVNMGHNRMEAMALARELSSKPEFLLFIDADMIWRPNHDFRFPDIVHKDAYLIKIEHLGMSWSLPMFVRAEHPWKYTGEAHATLASDTPIEAEILEGAYIEHTEDGVRRSTQDHSVKYEQDINKLKKQLREDPNNTRAMYYIAQSYASTGNAKKAIEWYRKRAKRDDGTEEVWASLFYIGLCRNQDGSPLDVVEKALLKAFDKDPRRAEPLVYLAHRMRNEGRPERAFLYASCAKDIPYPRHAMLNVEDVIYQWQALDEYAVTAYMIGRNPEANAAFTELLERAPDTEQDRIRQNLASVQSVIDKQEALKVTG